MQTIQIEHRKMNYTNVGQVIWSLWAELKLHSGLITQNVQGSVLVQPPLPGKGNKAGTHKNSYVARHKKED